MKKDLTPKQRKFVTEYLRLGNGVEAARAAGYKGNANVLAVVSSENLRKHNVQMALTARMESVQVTEEKITNELGKMAFEETEEPLKNDQKIKCLQILARVKGMTRDREPSTNVSTIQLIQMFEAGKTREENRDTEQMITVESG